MDNVVYKIRRKSDGLFLNQASHQTWTKEGKMYLKKGYAKAAVTSLRSGAARKAERPYWHDWREKISPAKEKEKAEAVSAAITALEDSLEIIEFSVVPVATYSADDFRSL